MNLKYEDLQKAINIAQSQGILKDAIMFADGPQLIALGADVDSNGFYKIENGEITLIGYLKEE